MHRGILCQTLMTEIEATCPHGASLEFEGRPLRLHMCFGADSGDEGGPDLSVEQGLDFTTDICPDADSVGDSSGGDASLMEAIELGAMGFPIGTHVRYNAAKVAFEAVAG